MTWEDLDFLLNYRKTTKALMWCAYVTTAMAFGTGLFTVMAPKSLWLAILILILCSIFPFLSKIIGEWPLLMLRYRLGCSFRKDLLPNIWKCSKLCRSRVRLLFKWMSEPSDFLSVLFLGIIRSASILLRWKHSILQCTSS